MDATALARALEPERGGEPVGHGGGSHREFPKIGRLRCRAVSRFAGTRGAAGMDVARCARAFYRVIRGCETRTRSSTLVPNGKVWLGCVRVRRCVRSCARLETDMLVTCRPKPSSETARSGRKMLAVSPNPQSRNRLWFISDRSTAKIPPPDWLNSFRMAPTKFTRLTRVNNPRGIVRISRVKCGNSPGKHIFAIAEPSFFAGCLLGLDRIRVVDHDRINACWGRLGYM